MVSALTEERPGVGERIEEWVSRQHQRLEPLGAAVHCERQVDQLRPITKHNKDKMKQKTIKIIQTVGYNSHLPLSTQDQYVLCDLGQVP